MYVLWTLLVFFLPLLTWAVDPTPNTVLNGAFVLNGGGSTIDAATLPSQTGYFMNSGSLVMNDITLKNFKTLGGVGSGGGAGLGGTLFINNGVTVTLNDIHFISSNVLGGSGGQGVAGGVLNNIFVPTSSGTNGSNANDANVGYPLIILGNGGPGKQGQSGGAASNGFGGKGGNGGIGGNGTPGYLQQAQSVTDSALFVAKVIADAVATPALQAQVIAITAANVAQLAFVNPALLGYQVVVGAVFTPVITAFQTTAVYLSGGVSVFDAGQAALAAAWTLALTVTGYQVGASGRGGNGGSGGTSGLGSFGFGGERGGDGGNGGAAQGGSTLSEGGQGGQGGSGGFGGGGGRGGNSGVIGANGAGSLVNAQVLANAAGGSSGFGGGSGSLGSNGVDGVGVNGILGQGGSGFGGAIFVNTGGSLTMTGSCTFCGDFAEAGLSLNGGPSGYSIGTDLFMMNGATVALNPGSGNTITFNGTIADNSPTSISNLPFGNGSGAGISLQSGLAIFNGRNSYVGQTSISGGSIFQAVDGVGVNTASNIFLNGGTFQSEDTFRRLLGTGSNNIQFGPGTSNRLVA